MSADMTTAQQVWLLLAVVGGLGALALALNILTPKDE